MIDKFTIRILLLAFVLSISMIIYEAGRIEALEEKIAVLSIQIEEADSLMNDFIDQDDGCKPLHWHKRVVEIR